MLYPHYKVIITRRAVMTLKRDWEEHNLAAASIHFLEFMESGDLVWWQEGYYHKDP
jgi:hypothetical protein